MKKWILIVSIIFLSSSCTTFKLEKDDLEARYSYPMWQEKHVRVEKTAEGFTIEIKSTSDPVNNAMASVDKLSDAIKALAVR